MRYTCAEGDYADPGPHSKKWFYIRSVAPKNGPIVESGMVCSNHVRRWTLHGYWEVYFPFRELCKEALGQTSGSTSASQDMEQ